MRALDVAIAYARRGWSVIPVPHQSKNPGLAGWQRLRLTEGDLPAHFNGHPQNIGVLLGEPSGWLIDVDLDHPRAVELAEDYLPPTPAVFGRAGKPRSHRLYRVAAPVATKKYRSKSAGMLLEVRSTGAQTVFPPSTHETGEPIEWQSPDAEPALVEPEQLLKAAAALAAAVLVELGEKSPAKPKAERKVRAERAVDPADDLRVPAEEAQSRSLAAMLRIRTVDQRDGSSRLYAAACRSVEYGLDDASALAVIRRYERQRPFPRPWSDDEVLRRVRDAERACERGSAVTAQRDGEGLIRLGTRDPESDRLVLSPKRTLPTAEAYVREHHAHPDGRTLHAFADMLLQWQGNRYAELEDGGVKNQLQGWLHDALRYHYNPRTGESKLVNFESNPSTVNAALDTIRGFVHLPATTPIPCWLGGVPGLPAPIELLPCRSTLLHLPTLNLLDPTPALFTTNALDFDPDLSAPPPMAWLRFLHELFDDDLQSQDLLQEWCGYSLTADTSQQKMLLLVGPRRSGKGTIARVLARLVGSGNVCGPTTSSLAGNFGLQPLLGKTLAIVSDARFSGENIATVVERLLCISGEDTLTVDRKFLPSVTLKLPTRFTFLSNELPRLTDASNALAGRFLILRLTQSFYGREDPGLTDKLLAELPGILNWAIEGWQRLRARGHFVMPESVADAVQDLEDLSSPVGAFVREECVVDPRLRVSVDDMYDAWKRWCEREGRTIVSTRQSFGRDLASAVPGIKTRRNHLTGRFYDGITLSTSKEPSW